MQPTSCYSADLFFGVPPEVCGALPWFVLGLGLMLQVQRPPGLAHSPPAHFHFVVAFLPMHLPFQFFPLKIVQGHFLHVAQSDALLLVVVVVYCGLG